MTWLRRYWIPLALFAFGFTAYSGVACDRMRRQSPDPHFVYQADAWLHGKLAIDPPPKKGDDWAKVETVVLDDGSRVRGRRLNTRRVFAIAGGTQIPLKRIARSEGMTHFVSFPPLPAALMIPQAALHGRVANDVFMTVLVAALALPLMWLLLLRLRDAGLSERTDRDNLLLTLAFGFGTVFFFSAVQGRVWFTAHIVGVVIALSYLLCAVEARRPLLAGLLLGLGAVTRVPLAFMFPLFAFEAWRMYGDRADLKPFLRRCALFAAPVVAVAVVAMLYNAARFDDPLEFGHSYLAVKQQAQMETIGKFSPRYLSRNLTVAFTLLPDFLSNKPYISISGHGLAIWFTTPLLVLVLWPRVKNALHRPLWITVALVAIPTLMYQNSGWLQFGYRFSLDYMVLLFALLAIGGRPLRRVAYGLVVAAVLINLFGALTFARSNQYYRADNSAYSTVMKH